MRKLYRPTAARGTMLMTASALAIFACAANAQTATADGAQEMPQASEAPGDAEIIVTAQRRDERLKDVPATVTVQTGEQLETAGIVSIRDLSLVTPGLNFTGNGGTTVPAIRGISGNGSGGPGSESNVALYVDGIYFPSQVGAALDLPDIAQVEVLKGPQGTLYGRNATGGAILVTTLSPSYELQGNASLSYGSYNTLEAKGQVSVPLVDDVLSLGLSAHYRRSDGYNWDIGRNERVGEIDAKTFRAKLRFDPSSSVHFVLTGFYSRIFDESVFNNTLINGNSSARNNYAGPIAISRDPNTTALDFPSFLKTENWGLTLRSTFETESAGTLTSLTSYMKIDTQVNTDADYTNRVGTNYIIFYSEPYFSQELIYQAPSLGPVDIQLGASYLDDRPAQDLNVVGLLHSIQKVKTEALAGYIDVTWNITPEFSLRGGGRYSWEEKSQYGPAPTATYPFVADASFRDFTPSVTAMYKFPDVGNVYASYKDGFKSGTFNANSPSGIPVRPEKVSAYEVGFKSNLRGPFNFNIAGYRMNYRDIQISTVNQGVATLQNAATAKIKGIDFDATYKAGANFNLSTTASILDAKFDEFPNASVFIPRTACGIGTAPCGNVLVSIDASGNYLTRAPKFTASLTANKGFELGNSRLDVSATYYHSSAFFWEPGNRTRQSDYDVLNGRITFTPSSDLDLEISLWGKNLTNAHYGQGSLSSGTADTISYSAPRTVGVSTQIRF